jgi:hypothetical protein
MSDKLTSAIETMTEQVSAKLAEVAELKRATNTLCKVAGIDPIYPDADEPQPGVLMRMRPDEYYGKAFSTAARDYLKRRNQAVSAEDIVAGLEQGSFDFDAQGWKPEGRLRTVAASLAKNTAVFHRLPNGLFGLKEWYPDAIERKTKGKKDSDEKENGTDNNEAASE